MEKKESIFHILVDIAELYDKERHPLPDEALSNGALRKLIEKAMEYYLFTEYELGEKDLIAVAVLFSAYLHRNRSVGARELIEGLEGGGRALLRGLERIKRLREKDIIRFSIESVSASSREEIFNVELKGINILEARLYLSDEFLEELSELEANPAIHKPTPYRDNYEYLVDQFERIRLIKSLTDSPEKKLGYYVPKVRPLIKHDGIQEKLKRLERRIGKRVEVTSRELPLEKLKEEKKLTRVEEIVVLAVLKAHMLKYNILCTEYELIRLVSRNTYERLLNRGLFEKDSTLLKEKIITIHRDILTGEGGAVRLNPTLAERLAEP